MSTTTWISIFFGFIFLAGIAADVSADGQLATTWGAMKKGERGFAAAPPNPAIEKAIHIFRVRSNPHHRPGHDKGGGGEDPTPPPPGCDGGDSKFEWVKKGGWVRSDPNTSVNEKIPYEYESNKFPTGTKAAIDNAIFTVNGFTAGGPLFVESPGFTTLIGTPNLITTTLFDDSQVLARATVWYYRLTKQFVAALLEFSEAHLFQVLGGEQCGLFDTSAFDWENIAIHEFCHWCNLDHNQKDTDSTVYPYASPGETKKRSLMPGDQIGVERFAIQ